MYKSGFFTYIYIRAKKLGFRKKRDGIMATKTMHLKSDFIYTVCQQHLCPACASRLKVRKAVKTVKLTSPDDSLEFDTVRLIFKEFVCEKCNSVYSVNDIKQYEKEHPKENRK